MFKTTTTVSKEKIKDPVFPLYFSIILKEGFDLTKLKLHGYPSAIRFYIGHILPWNKHQPYDWRGVRNSTVQSETWTMHCITMFN